MSIFVDIEKDFGDFHLNVQLSGEDEVIALLGASGCGKSLTLRCIAGIEKPDWGRILLNDVTLFDSQKGINLPPQQRRAGLLFQNYALFPHMTVAQNIRAGTCREKNSARRQHMTADMLKRFQLEDVAGHYPHQISGGQQQRAALARLLVSAPHILLLDEPFSALDSHLRLHVEQELQEILRQFGKTALIVSHDREEVYRLADRLAVMSRGNVDVIGKTTEVFRNPRTKNAAILTGCDNISRAVIIDSTHIQALDWGLMLEVPPIRDDTAYAGIRAQDIAEGTGINAVSCRVCAQRENAFSRTVTLRPESVDSAAPLIWELPKYKWRQTETVSVALPPEKILLLKG